MLRERLVVYSSLIQYFFYYLDVKFRMVTHWVTKLSLFRPYVFQGYFGLIPTKDLSKMHFLYTVTLTQAEKRA